MGWIVAAHVGAGHHSAAKEQEYIALLRRALARGHEVLQPGRDQPAQAVPTAVRAVTAVVAELEQSPYTNAAYGSNLNEHAQVECEASIVCGRSQYVAACAGMATVQHPVQLAAKLLESNIVANGTAAHGRQLPLVVAGDHCNTLAKRFGLAVTEAEALITEEARLKWEKWSKRIDSWPKEQELERLDTVGAICMDEDGNTAAALSSGGIVFKVPGRVGLAGCPRAGCQASNGASRPLRQRQASSHAIACSGRGEHFIRSAFVHELSAILRRQGKEGVVDLDQAFRDAFEMAMEQNGRMAIEGGALALAVSSTPKSSQSVQVGAAFTTPTMAVGFLHSGNSEPQVQVLRRPQHRTDEEDTATLVVHLSHFKLTTPLDTTSKQKDKHGAVAHEAIVSPYRTRAKRRRL